MKVFNPLKYAWRHLSTRIWLIVTAVLMVLVFTASMIATQHPFLRNTLNTVLGAERRVLVSGDPSKYQYFTADAEGFRYFDTTSTFGSKSETLKQANLLNEQIAEEGTVLLKNEGNALPLAAGAKVSVFGKNSVNLVYGGSGSGGGNTAGAATIYSSLDAAGFKVNPTLKSFYENRSQSGSGRGKNPEMGDTPWGIATGETAIARYTTAVKNSYASYNDAAIVVFSRIGGEGFDLPRTMKTSGGSDARTVSGASSIDDHYLQLDRNEKALLREVEQNFSKVIVIINSSAAMELGFLTDGSYDIDAALWIGSPGKMGINSLGRILSGSANPSGRLVDTYARDFKQDPTWNNFSNNLTPGGNAYTQGGQAANAYFVEYEEGIYVGYRYYETRGYVEEEDYGDDTWYPNNVVFPFGYGLSYTTFAWEIIGGTAAGDLSDPEGAIELTVKVTNTGNREGMDVVQAYYSAPYYYGEIEKSHVVLGDFAKTKVLKPNESQNVSLSIRLYDMASYDYSDANGNGHKGYELDDGIYSVFVGRNAHDAWAKDGSNLGREYILNQPFKYTADIDTKYTVENRFDEVSSHITTYLSRDDFEATMPTTPTVAEREVTGDFIRSLVYKVDDEGKPWYTDVEPTQGKSSGRYQLYDLIQWDKATGEVYVDYNDSRWDDILDRLTVSEMAYLIGTGNFNTDYITSIGKPKTTDPDGPAGFTNFMGDPTVHGTCFYASECVIGATFNTELIYDMGVMVGIEGIWGDTKGDGRPYSGWYAPAMNIHRSPFSGRNFEYYSEDGYLSGIMGASVIAGAKSKGVYTYVKHFVLNDQETNRDTNGLITWANEQSMREIYFRAFELAVKVGKTTAIMSSFNRIGTVWAGGSYDLLTEVLRNEWGFKGMVISDYNLYDHMPADQMIRAGGDLNLTQYDPPTTSSSALTPTQIAAMRQATKNILYTVAQSNAMNGMGEGVVYRYAMPMWMIWVIVGNISLAVVCGGIGTLLVVRLKRKARRAAAAA